MKKIIFCVLGITLLLGGCANDNRDYYGSDESDGAMYNEQTNEYITDKNEFAQIDSYRPRTMEDREASSARWDTARKETRWQEYKGTMVRVEILLGDTDARHMRLRLMQNASGTDVDADSRTILARVADYEMKRVCGRNAESIVMIYDEPSFEVMRPTTFFDYRIEAEGVTMREYGFRCVYKK